MFANRVTISLRQRNARQCVTLIEDLEDELDIKRIAKFMGKEFHCNSNVLKDEQGCEIIRLTGDQRQTCQDFLVKHQICEPDQIIIRGV